ncbi:hypothetical protein DMJ13_18970 [halophilic archaeon]|nr:hypothetical protein DMJ13_18970 [halophilic archaeon]
MAELARRTRSTPLGILVGLWVLGGLYELWTSRINWQNIPVVAFVGSVTAVGLGCLVWAVGVTTGDYSHRPVIYRRLMRFFGGVGLVFLGVMAISAFA